MDPQRTSLAARVFAAGDGVCPASMSWPLHDRDLQPAILQQAQAATFCWLALAGTGSN